ncbi:MAG: succinate dehydrogenase iron-sulfur subunit, partial [Legionellales bacterium]|nr:succinate dehydrogenase iron-sulfur subunit [Legionellales bacterium]
MKNIEFSIYRYNPENDKSVYMQEYTLEIEKGQDLMLLGALERIKDE